MGGFGDAYRFAMRQAAERIYGVVGSDAPADDLLAWLNHEARRP